MGKKSQTQSARAGLAFPVGRMRSRLQKWGYMDVSSAATSVYFAAVVEYIVGELLEAAAVATDARKKSLITPRMIMMGIAGDDELKRVFRQYHVCGGGVMPTAKDAKVAKRAAKRAATKAA